MKVLVFKDIKNKRWTIWDEKKTIHLGYLEEFFLSECIFFVNEEKRKKVLKTKKRFPHAFVVGKLIKNQDKKLIKEISYNPFKDRNFKMGNKKCTKSKLLFFRTDGKVFSK